MGVLDKLESKVVGKAQANVKDRIEAITNFPGDAKDTLLSGKSEVMDKKPVQGVLTMLDNVGSGAIKLVKKQVEITRRWVPY
jgi:hypothetical protein